ncbi:Transcriptional regulatory protein FixJ [Gemmata obscuriglobus]|uniref:Response regulatory domain-containing protein n=1 Tax=Gemmata obscuriglobus TaxID=114 RepID=A0A2Z3HD83_9BACT|nr:response regulator [Gemmata obscuriglobus]AWM41537.1 hypothetical protein C1280_34080 [Gemmata obscuriglobus]QEG32551.1 Transcriptional regulatory protein FixJ [Gemmata obscuriglobus]VTS11907.1 hypothetical protein : Uncharacterized protein OS=uncultured Desulfofustis sp. PB-SRB1 GN=N839_02770 PE=4 SV=1: Response_reg [Gemmata obscuriglobus UQM 2246]
MTATDLVMRPLGGARVLVAAGAPDDSASLTAVLRLNGFDAREAHSADAVISSVAEIRPSVLVTDLDLTDGDGCEFVSRVRRLPKAPAVVVVTGHTAGSIRRAALAAGAAAFLLKPADPIELALVVERLSGGRD